MSESIRLTSAKNSSVANSALAQSPAEARLTALRAKAGISAGAVVIWRDARAMNAGASRINANRSGPIPPATGQEKTPPEGMGAVFRSSAETDAQSMRPGGANRDTATICLWLNRDNCRFGIPAMQAAQAGRRQSEVKKKAPLTKSGA